MKPIFDLNDTLGFGKRMIDGKCVRDMTIKELLDTEEGYGYIAWALDKVQGFKLTEYAFIYAKKTEHELILKARARRSCRVRPYGIQSDIIKIPLGEFAELSIDMDMAFDELDGVEDW